MSIMKIMEIRKEFAQAMRDKKSGDSSQLFDVCRKVVGECVKKVEITFSKPLTGVEDRVRLCTASEFDTLLAGYNWKGLRPTAFPDPLGRFIAVDVGSLLRDSNSWESFAANFVMNVMEELIHVSFPSESELDVKRKTHQVTESYLEWQIPKRYKKDSLKRAVDPNY